MTFTEDEKREVIKSYVDEIDRLCALLADVLDYARHTHEARYFKNEAEKMVLTDACNKCGMDLRHDIHSPAVPLTPGQKSCEEKP